MYAVEMRGITKKFHNIAANDHVFLNVKKGEIHSLLGENGAGKTTLMNILYGIYAADEGEILINGARVDISSPLQATRHKIAMVHQHFMLVDNMTVAENVVLGHETKKGIRFDLAQANRRVEEVSKEYGLVINPREFVGNLSVGLKQRAEIIKALYRNANIIILDEPTAVLTSQEINELFEVLAGLRKLGKTIIIITHKLRETLALADTISILRKGKNVTTIPTREADENILAELMVGRLISFNKNKQAFNGDGQVLFEVEKLNYTKNGIKKLTNISFNLRAGEILGVAGVEGNGQTELIETLTGIIKPTSGTIKICGKYPAPFNAKTMIKHRLGHIPEDRGKRGLVKELTIADNLMLGYHWDKKFTKRGAIQQKALDEYASAIIKDYCIYCDGSQTKTGTLSGGNQQKVVIGRVFAGNPQVIIVAQPTRGLDVGAIEYIHAQLLEMRRQGKAILLISAELDEIVELSDRIAVIYEGSFVAIGDADTFDEMSLGGLMANKSNKEQQKDVNGE